MQREIAYQQITGAQKKVKAFLLIETQSKFRNGVIRTISDLPGVASVNAVSGIYDVIAVVERNSIDEIGDLVVTHMQPIIDLCRCAVCLVTPSREPPDKG